MPMLRALLALILLLLPLGSAHAQLTRAALPPGFEYWPGADHDPAVPTTEAVLGHAIGEEIVLSADVRRYFDALAAARPDQVRIIDYGQSWEGRPLWYAVIGSAQNIARSEAIAEAKLGRRPFEVEFRYAPRGGGVRHARAIAKMVVREGQPARTHGIVQDITERKLAEERQTLDAARLETLVQLSRLGSADLPEICSFVLDAATHLSDSSAGFVALVDEEADRLELSLDVFAATLADPSLGITKVEDNLWLLRSGGRSKSPTELLEKPAFTQFLASLKQHFDLVVVDSPPMGAVTDAILIAERTDEVVELHSGRTAPATPTGASRCACACSATT